MWAFIILRWQKGSLFLEIEQKESKKEKRGNLFLADSSHGVWLWISGVWGSHKTWFLAETSTSACSVLFPENPRLGLLSSWNTRITWKKIGWRIFLGDGSKNIAKLPFNCLFCRHLQYSEVWESRKDVHQRRGLRLLWQVFLSLKFVLFIGTFWTKFTWIPLRWKCFIFKPHSSERERLICCHHYCRGQQSPLTLMHVNKSTHFIIGYAHTQREKHMHKHTGTSTRTCTEKTRDLAQKGQGISLSLSPFTTGGHKSERVTSKGGQESEHTRRVSFHQCSCLRCVAMQGCIMMQGLTRQNNFRSASSFACSLEKHKCQQVNVQGCSGFQTGVSFSRGRRKQWQQQRWRRMYVFLKYFAKRLQNISCKSTQPKSHATPLTSSILTIKFCIAHFCSNWCFFHRENQIKHSQKAENLRDKTMVRYMLRYPSGKRTVKKQSS